MGSSSELFKVKTLDEAIEIMKPYVLGYYQRVETVSLVDSLGRILTQAIPATCAVPNFRKSTMDGMAVRAADTFGSSESMPALLMSWRSENGRSTEGTLKQGDRNTNAYRWDAA